MVPRVVRLLGPGILLAVALVSLVAALRFGGGAAPGALSDPGAVVRWGLPVAKLLFDLGEAVTLGALVLAVIAFSREEPAYGAALDLAAGASAVWAVASLASSLFDYVSVGATFSLDSRFGDGYADFLTSVSSGQAWLATTVIAAAITVLCFAVRNQTVVLGIAIGAVLGLLPISQQGHSGDSASHDVAVGALWLHLLGAGVWLGGLVTIAILRPRLDGARLPAVLARYSSIALVCFVVVAASGYTSAEIRVRLDQLLTPYGVLVLVKATALVALGLFGAAQRRLIIGRIGAAGADRVRRQFWILVGGELAFMGLASGVAAALARTETPIPDTPVSTNPTPAEILTTRPLPPELTFARYFTEWNLDLMWILVCGFAIAFYLAGVWRLHRRGDRWPVHRTILWILGILLLFYITDGGVNVYQEYLFSVHMLAHMTLTMVVPILLVPAAPVTLALRAIRKRDDGSRGPREWILLAVHSRVARLLANPIVAALLFAGSLWVFYYTPLFSWATTDHYGHEWMTIHFLITGYLFVQALIGVDPVPYRAPYPMRLILLLATMAFHAFFGLSLMTGKALLLANWFGAMGRTGGPSALADQQTGGGIAWSVGEIPTVALAIVVAIMWSRSDAREATRHDRAADRDGEAELAAYNAMLAERARRG